MVLQKLRKLHKMVSCYRVSDVTSTCHLGLNHTAIRSGYQFEHLVFVDGFTGRSYNAGAVERKERFLFWD